MLSDIYHGLGGYCMYTVLTMFRKHYSHGLWSIYLIYYLNRLSRTVLDIELNNILFQMSEQS